MTAKFAVADDQLRQIRRKMRRIEEQLDQEAGCPHDPAKINGALQAIFEGKFAEAPDAPVPVIRPAQQLIHRMFVSCEEQVGNIRKWNKKFGWGFSEEQVAVALQSAPIWPTHSPLTVAVLVPYLETVGKTFEALWTIAKSCQKDSWRYEGLYSEADKLRLLELKDSKIDHKPGLRWEVIDLAANWDKKDGIVPATVQDPKTSPHAGILAAAAHFPKWVRKMDDINVPYVWLPGYQATIPDYDAWTGLPRLYFVRSFRQIGLYADHRSGQDRRYAVPAFRE